MASRGTPPPPADPDATAGAFLAGGGAAGALARALDWSKTPLGPVSAWSRSLRTTVGTLLHSRHPMFLWWGPDLVQIYNDAYTPSFGRGKHPAAMGQRGRECWQEIWPIIWPQIEDVMSRGKPSWNEDALVPILRNGRLEEVYWTYGYSPVFDDDDRIGGTLVVCTETTPRVLSERRLRTIRQLADRTAAAQDAASLVEALFDVLRGAAFDVPFALLGRVDRGEAPRVEAATHEGGAAQLLEAIARAHRAASRANAPAAPIALPAGLALPDGAWPEPATEALVQPVAIGGPEALLVFGLSPRLSFDAAYRELFAQIVEHIELAATRIESFRIRALVEGERRNLLLQAPVATALLTGPTHVFELANPLYRKMVGGREVLGKSYVEAFPEVAGTDLLAVVDGVYRYGVPYVAEEYHVALDRRGEGTLEDCYFRFSLEPLRDGAGRVYGMMVVAVDVTEQVSARRVLEKGTVEREKLLAELESANRAKDEFLAMLGHELRNPLAPIVTAVQLMKLKDAASLMHEREIIERQANHLIGLVDDLLDVSRVARGKVDLKRERVAIAEVIDRAVEMAAPLFERKRHQLALDVPRMGLDVDADIGRLAQVVSNVLTNAAKYTDAGGRISLVAARDGGDVVIRIADNGAGIPAEQLPHLFEAFFQGPQARDRAAGGLGLGLALVRSLVELHGGRVSAQSAGAGKGTELALRLPLSIHEATIHDRPSPHDDMPATDTGLEAHPRRVLLVDDNEDLTELFAMLLRSVGHIVEVASNGPEALRIAAAFEPEVAVVDIGLPVMDGYELAAQLRAAFTADRLRLVAMTGYGQARDRERSHAAGFDKHLVKPVDGDALLDSIRKVDPAAGDALRT